MVERLAKFGVGGTTMDADDVAKRWSVLDTTPFPEFTEAGDQVEKEFVGLLLTISTTTTTPPLLPPSLRQRKQHYRPNHPNHPSRPTTSLPATASSRLSTSTGVATWIPTSAFPT